MTTRTLTAALVSAGLIFSSVSALADETSAENKAAAREFAVDGIKLAQAGECEAALPKLERAEALYHAPTILTWVGECQLELGRLVQGSETLNRVVRENLSADAPAAYVDSQERAKKLRAEALPKIARLTLTIEPEQLEGLEVTLDGRSINTALIGAATPTDPGERTVRVSAPGYEPQEKTISLSSGAKEALTFTLIEDATGPAPLAATSKDAAQGEESSQSSSTVRTLGWIGVGVGGALLAGGGVMGAMAMGEKGNLDCPNNSCSMEQKETYDAANMYATTSTILFAAGGVLGATGVLLLVLGKDSSEMSADVAGAHVTPTLGLGSVGLNGSF